MSENLYFPLITRLKTQQLGRVGSYTMYVFAAWKLGRKKSERGEKRERREEGKMRVFCMPSSSSSLNELSIASQKVVTGNQCWRGITKMGYAPNIVIHPLLHLVLHDLKSNDAPFLSFSLESWNPFPLSVSLSCELFVMGITYPHPILFIGQVIQKLLLTRVFIISVANPCDLLETLYLHCWCWDLTLMCAQLYVRHKKIQSLQLCHYSGEWLTRKTWWTQHPLKFSVL